MLPALLVLAMSTTVVPAPSNPVHYRITLKSERRVDSTAAGDDARGGTYTVVAFVTATTSGARAEVIIDSVRCSGTGLMSMAFDSTVGARSRGARYDFPIGMHMSVIPTPSMSNSLTNTLAQVALMLFPTMNPEMKVGVTWSDSLDTSAMSDAPARNRPVVTHWKVASLGADTAVVVGDVRGSLTYAGRVLSAGLITGTRLMTLAGGVLRSMTSATRQETLMAPEGATSMTVGIGTTSLQIVSIP